LARTEISAAGISHLANLPRLEKLWLSSCRITDDAIERLVGIDTLVVLDVQNTNTTDKGVCLIARLKSVADLNVSGTQVTGVRFEIFDRIN
jgi:hypothetical protein